MNVSPGSSSTRTHTYLHLRRTKIVATVGPATSSDAMLEKLLRAGVNVCRVNFSHGEGAEHVKLIRRIRKHADALGVPVAVLADLCGPKVRVGEFAGGAVRLKDKSTVTITTKKVTGTAELIPSQYKGIVHEARRGERILLDDGNLELKVTGRNGDTLSAKVMRGGVLKNRKGMNLPDTDMKVAALTAKDRRDVGYCVEAGVDYIALSFVRRAADVRMLLNLLKKHGADIPVIAKIEKPEALDNAEDILNLSAGIMVARGDLGVEMPPEQVPMLQNRLISLANHYNKPVIVATQMMESMIEHSRPTRAEVSDVAGACLAGADAVMLSAETAAGRYPLETVKIMDAVLREAEAYQFFSLNGTFKKAGADRKSDLQDIMGIAVAQLSRDLKAHAEFVLTRTGHTARMVAADRPAAPIFAMTADRATAARLNLVWGITPCLLPGEVGRDAYIDAAEKEVKARRIAKKGDYLLMLSACGGTGGKTTNTIEAHRVR